MARTGSDIAYLDYNATAPAWPEAIAAAARAAAAVGNPSSVHAAGRRARLAVEEAREAVASAAGAAPARVVFTGSGTEANNLALRGSGRARLLVSAIEHDSVLRAAPEAERIPVLPSGVIDLDALAEALAREETPALVSLMLANNETGVLQPVAAAAEIAHANGALLHCDAVQAIGRIPVDAAALGADLMTLSAHKIGGLPGTGALIVADHVPLAAEILGGGQERGRRAGTENVPGIVAFGAAAGLVPTALAGQPRVAALRDGLEAEVLALAPGAVLFGRDAERLPNTSCIALPGAAAETQVMVLDLAGVAVSAGAACSSGKVAPSHVLAAMGAGEEVAGSAIRVSLGLGSGAADVERFIAAWRPVARRVAAGSAAA